MSNENQPKTEFQPQKDYQERTELIKMLSSNNIGIPVILRRSYKEVIDQRKEIGEEKISIERREEANDSQVGIVMPTNHENTEFLLYCNDGSALTFSLDNNATNWSAQRLHPNTGDPVIFWEKGRGNNKTLSELAFKNSINSIHGFNEIRNSSETDTEQYFAEVTRNAVQIGQERIKAREEALRQNDATIFDILKGFNSIPPENPEQ